MNSEYARRILSAPFERTANIFDISSISCKKHRIFPGNRQALSPNLSHYLIIGQFAFVNFKPVIDKFRPAQLEISRSHFQKAVLLRESDLAIVQA